MRTFLSRWWLSAGLVASLAISADASITTVGGAAIVVVPPADITNDVWVSDTQVRVWFEREVTLGAALSLDHVNTGAVTSSALLVPGFVSPGTTVGSYMIRFDPLTSTTQSVTGFVILDTPILGVLQDRPTLGATDLLLGRPGVTYNTNTDRGLELNTGANADWFTISADRLRIDFRMAVTDGPTDDIRVVTAVPSPTSAALLLTIVGTPLRRRRR